MSRAGFCRVCGENVWLTDEGAGLCGHPAQEMSGVYEVGEPAAPEVPSAPVAATGAPMPAPTAVAVPAEGKAPSAFARFVRSPRRSVPTALAIVAILALAIVFFPRPRFVVGAIRVPDDAVSGDDIVLTVEIANEGWLRGEEEIVVLVDGQAAATELVELAAGDAADIDITLKGDHGAGMHDVTLSGWEEVGASLRILTPPEFEVAWVDVSPNPMDLNKGKDATVFVEVSNVGEADGSETLRLTVDGEEKQSRDVFLLGGTSSEESFQLTLDKPGACEVAVNGVAVDVAIHQLTRPSNGTVVVNKLKGGANRLKITNNNERDVVVVLSKPGEGQPALLAVLVRAKSSYTLKGIKDGTYTCYYVHGSAWCSHCKRFTENPDYGVFEGDSVLKSGGGSYTESTVTFGITTGSGTPTDDVGEDAFPEM